VLHQAGSTTLDGAGYTYDFAGSRTSKTNYLNGITSNYGYDAIYELLQVTQGGSTTESYSYDAVGNRLSSTGVPTYSYNSSNELTSNSSGSYTYDNNGNTLTDATGKGYTWDFEDRMVSAVVPGTGTVAFKYDPFGRRIQKSGPLGTTNYLYDGDNPIEEVDQTGSMLARYTQGLGVDEQLAQLRSGTTSYYQADGLGSVTSLTNSTGAVASTYGYDTFGNLTASSGTLTNPFQYAGREFDPESGLAFLRHRYYSTIAGRFLSEDPIGFLGGKDFYEYVRNNPVNAVDPFGEKTVVIIVYDPGPFGWGSFGSHAALYIDNGGDPIIYDPAGDYSRQHKCGSGNSCSDEGANIDSYNRYYTGDGTYVKTFEFDTTTQQEKQIAKNIEKEGGASGGFCALSVADVISGIGPFKNLKRKFLPGSLADQLAKLPKDCQCKQK
jgi:RHS repeat-associated protein